GYAMDTRACGMGLMRGVYTQFTTENIFCSKKYLSHGSLLAGYPWGAGYGIIRPPISLMPVPTQQKDLAHVAPPAHHRACPGRHRPYCPSGLSQRPSLRDIAGCPGDDFSGRGLYRLVPSGGPTGLAPVASRVGDHHAVSGDPGRSPGGGGRPRAHRLEVSAET